MIACNSLSSASALRETYDSIRKRGRGLFSMFTFILQHTRFDGISAESINAFRCRSRQHIEQVQAQINMVWSLVPVCIHSSCKNYGCKNMQEKSASDGNTELHRVICGYPYFHHFSAPGCPFHCLVSLFSCIHLTLSY